MTNNIELASQIWYELIVRNNIPKDGVVVEVAPGYEPKIGRALREYGFRGTLYLVEPDEKAAGHILATHRAVLPGATVLIVGKSMQEIVVGVDLPARVDLLCASHPFDDMVIYNIVGKDASIFTEEKNGGEEVSSRLKSFYDSIAGKDYADAVSVVAADWQNFIAKLSPKCFIASQYPSHTLTVKGLIGRQESGYAVLDKLKGVYKNLLVDFDLKNLHGQKGDKRWWIVARNDDHARPAAMDRLGEEIFVPERARKLAPDEYEIVYADGAPADVGSLAIVLDSASNRTNEIFRSSGRKINTTYTEDFSQPDHKNFISSVPRGDGVVTVYADRQKDLSEIGLSGNLGSGRAVYFGDRFNILGVGKTSLCVSPTPSHSTGHLELVGAMRRIVLSRWLNCFTKRAPEHIALFALKKDGQFKWCRNPIRLCLLVRTDDGSLDRPSHVEQSPGIPVDFGETLNEYAKIDAEYFAYRFLLGAWSTSNYSLAGHVIDLESASFAKHRGPYHTSSAKYPHNRFGYEGFGFVRILTQLAGVKKIEGVDIEGLFYKKRREHLGLCFLLLLGVAQNQTVAFFKNNRKLVLDLSERFEALSKKISHENADLNLYFDKPEVSDPTLLDMSRLFRGLAEIYNKPDAEGRAFELLMREGIRAGQSGVSTSAADYLREHAVVGRDEAGGFVQGVKSFVRDLFTLLRLLNENNCMDNKKRWANRLVFMNQDLPTMSELNNILKSLAESYRLGQISGERLSCEIKKLCRLPETSTATPLVV